MDETSDIRGIGSKIQDHNWLLVIGSGVCREVNLGSARVSVRSGQGVIQRELVIHSQFLLLWLHLNSFLLDETYFPDANEAAWAMLCDTPQIET